ncbi:TPA: phage tail protein [Klebsiella variicola subsp. variicola]|nr:phage tail protein [Klebsiella variicola subsp. variicola]
MTQLDELHRFIHDHVPGRLMDTAGADEWMDDIELVRSVKDLGLGQRRIAVRRYSGVLAWERWPYRQISPDFLFALVCAWLDDHGNDLREQLSLDDPTVYVEVRDNQTAIIMITVPLVDDITLVPDENGPVPYGTERYRLDAPEIHAATDLTVYGIKAGEDDAG